MQNRQKLGQELELMGTFRLITQAYEEISVMRMQKIRNTVLATRVFFSEVSKVFVDVKVNYEKNILGMKRKNLSMLEKNGKKAAVMISTSTKLNGDIMFKVFKEFMEYIKTHDVDIIIAGKMGKQLYDQSGFSKEYQYFDFSENNINNISLKDIITALLPYKEVEAFYGKFESLLNQKPTLSSLTGEDDEEKMKAAEATPFVFEPSIEKILEFFETQIFASLLKQSVNESELARYASRIRAMEEAGQNIDKLTKGLLSQQSKNKKIISNKKQLEVMSHVIGAHTNL